MEKELISWLAPEFETYDRSVLWYLGVIFFAGILLAISLWTQNFLFAIFIVLATGLAIIWSQKEPTNFKVTITERGVKIGNSKIFPLAELANFSISEGAHNNLEWAKLVLQSKHWFVPLVAVFIPQGKLGQARDILAKYLTEIPYEPSLHDEVIRFLKL